MEQLDIQDLGKRLQVTRSMLEGTLREAGVNLTGCNTRRMELRATAKAAMALERPMGVPPVGVEAELVHWLRAYQWILGKLWAKALHEGWGKRLAAEWQEDLLTRWQVEKAAACREVSGEEGAGAQPRGVAVLSEDEPDAEVVWLVRHALTEWEPHKEELGEWLRESVFKALGELEVRKDLRPQAGREAKEQSK